MPIEVDGQAVEAPLAGFTTGGDPLDDDGLLPRHFRLATR
jgi:hypothetical protein